MKKSELNKMTKKNLLLHIEDIHSSIEIDHLMTQKSNQEMQDILAKYKEGSPENKLAEIRSSAGKLRYSLFHLDIPAADKKKVLTIVDKFLNNL
jgi:hypothetical protein